MWLTGQTTESPQSVQEQVGERRDIQVQLPRLHLSKRLEVESRSGTAQSIDLFYRLEHN